MSLTERDDEPITLPSGGHNRRVSGTQLRARVDIDRLRDELDSNGAVVSILDALRNVMARAVPPSPAVRDAMPRFEPAHAFARQEEGRLRALIQSLED
jgi:hypothetical protein